MRIINSVVRSFARGTRPSMFITGPETAPFFQLAPFSPLVAPLRPMADITDTQAHRPSCLPPGITLLAVYAPARPSGINAPLCDRKEVS